MISPVKASPTQLTRSPTVDPAFRAEIESFFQNRGLAMPERNAKQAWLIPSAEALPNPVGTAPGWFVKTEDKVIISMPGVPQEMKRMWADQAAPRLGRMLSGRSYSSVTIKTIGIGESALEEAISDLVAKTNPIVATYAKDDGVHVRVVGIADDEQGARRIRDEAADVVRQRLGPWSMVRTTSRLRVPWQCDWRHEDCGSEFWTRVAVGNRRAHAGRR